MSALPDGLVLRTARPSDLEQIGQLLRDRGDEVDSWDHKLVVEDPAAGWESCAVVVDGEKVVATATHLDETVRIGTVTVPAGQVELVATHEDYEGRGLSRALMGWAHERSASLGHLVQVMIGIPFFYRLFGYEYAIDIPPAREVVDLPEKLDLGPDGDSPYSFASFEEGDVAELMAMQEVAQASYDIAVPHPAARWRWLAESPAGTFRELVRGEEIVGSCRSMASEDSVVVTEALAVDEEAAEALLRAMVWSSAGEKLSVVHRALTIPGKVWEPRLGPASEYSEQYYVRIPALAPLLDALRPELERRLAAAGIDRAGKEIVISSFGSHVRIPVADDGSLGPAQTGGRLPWPASVGGAGVAPDQLGPLLFGPLGMNGLARRRPDVSLGPDEELFEALFPPQTADVLSYYQPW